ncbi:antitoxin [cf. Phormidesmis sp. LEGE 11477]|uniref:antitoxin n=1 Tax=cf. Phormidesmis sp. LEGE 11477 TaxID=1828680 RepID=UPI00187F406B|nr:antitoxin [cf. Phormidesmis sp. LEGE 11477]MBE9063451.1 antitoxin [cf. Phormidesmis sp. LEGE 11477]
MRTEYDFSKSIPNPYAEKFQKQETIQLEAEIVNYFQKLAEETSIPYKTLINLYLKDCVKSQRKLSLEWAN